MKGVKMPFTFICGPCGKQTDEIIIVNVKAVRKARSGESINDLVSSDWGEQFYAEMCSDCFDIWAEQIKTIHFEKKE